MSAISKVCFFFSMPTPSPPFVSEDATYHGYVDVVCLINARRSSQQRILCGHVLFDATSGHAMCMGWLA